MAGIPGVWSPKVCFVADSCFVEFLIETCFGKSQHVDDYSRHERQFSLNPISLDCNQGQRSFLRMFATSLKWPFCFLGNKAKFSIRPSHFPAFCGSQPRVPEREASACSLPAARLAASLTTAGHAFMTE